MQLSGKSRIVWIEAHVWSVEARQCGCNDPGSLSIGLECECATNRTIGSPAARICTRETGLEVATIKLASPNAIPRNQIVRVSPNRISIPSMTLTWLIYTAFGEATFAP